MKKKWLSVSLVMLLSFSMSMNVAAVEKPGSMLLTEENQMQHEIQMYEQKIKDVNTIWEKCEEGAVLATKRIENLQNDAGEAYSVTSYQFENEIYNSANKQVTALTTVYEMRAPGDPASMTDYAYDPTYNIRGEVTIYWDKGTYQGLSTKRLCKVSGENFFEDPAAKILSQKVMFGQAGTGPDGFVINECPATFDNPKKPTSTTWSYNTGCKKFLLNDAAEVFGASNTITMRRGTSEPKTFKVSCGTGV